MEDAMKNDMLKLTVQIVSAYIGHNHVAADALPAMIHSVYNTLSTIGTAQVEGSTALVPAVPIKKSVFPGYIICLEDGAKMKMLKRYLKTRFNLSPEQYREKWNLPRSYPMVAPDYTRKRSALAKSLGLGRKSQIVDAVVSKASARRSKG